MVVAASLIAVGASFFVNDVLGLSTHHNTLHTLLSVALCLILCTPIVCWAYKIGPFKNPPTPRT
jgi:hypothetical protein